MRFDRFIGIAAGLLLCLSLSSNADAAGRKKQSFTVEHPWAGARVAYLGDSITDPGVLKEDVHYWGFLYQWLDIEPLVYGKSGHQWHQILGQAEKMKQQIADEFDAIMIFVGTNDYNAGVPIGEWFTESKEVVNSDGKMVKRVRRAPVFDNSTLYKKYSS